MSGLTNTAVLVKYTFYGDATLDGKVDGSDYSRIDNGILHNLTGWANGDFNYDGHIDGSDYTLIDNAYNRQSAALPDSALATGAVATAEVAAVPEPASLSFAVIGLCCLLGRRCRQK